MTSSMTFYSGFGDVRFGILRMDNGEYFRGWNQIYYAATKHVPGGSVNELFLTGTGPLTLELNIWLATVTDYRQLQQLTQTVADLTIPAAVNELDVPEVDYFGTAYAVIPGVTLVGISQPRIALDRHVEADVTFQLQARP